MIIVIEIKVHFLSNIDTISSHIIFTVSMLKRCRFYFGFGGTDNARITIFEPSNRSSQACILAIAKMRTIGIILRQTSYYA